MINTFRDSKSVLAGTGTNGVSAAITASADGAWVNRMGYGGVVFDVTANGAPSADASNYWNLTLEHADEDPDNPGTPLTSSIEVAAPSDLLFAPGTQQDTFGATTIGAFAKIAAAVAADTLYSVGYRGIKPFVRFRPAATSAPGSTTFAAIARKTESSKIPPE